MKGKKAVREIVRYVFFGVLTTLVNLAVYFLSNRALGEDGYLISNVIAWILAVIFAYVTNKLWVFDSKSWNRDVLKREIPGFFAARAFSLLVEEAGLFLLIDLMGFGNRTFLGVNGGKIAKLAMQLVVIALNYVFSKLVVFSRRNRGKNAES